LWELVNSRGLSLISSAEASVSSVSEEQAKAFLDSQAAPAAAVEVKPKTPEVEEEDFDDLE